MLPICVCATSNLSDFAAQVANDQRLVCTLWRYCHELCSKAGRHMERQRPTMLMLLLQLMTAAASSAADAQRSATALARAAAAAAVAPHSSAVIACAASSASSSGGSHAAVTEAPGSAAAGAAPHTTDGRTPSVVSVGSVASTGVASVLGDLSSDTDSDGEAADHCNPGAAGVWGAAAPTLSSAGSPGAGSTRLYSNRHAVAAGGMGGGGRGAAHTGVSSSVVQLTVRDEDVQAQAWLPQLLLGLLHWSAASARQVWLI